MAAPTPPPPNNGGSSTPAPSTKASWSGNVTLTGTIGSSPCQLTVDSTGKTITLAPAASGAGAAITLSVTDLASFATGIFKDAGVTIALPSSIGSFQLSSLPSLTLSELQINLGTGGVILDAGVSIPTTSALNTLVPGLALTAISFDLTRTVS